MEAEAQAKKGVRNPELLAKVFISKDENGRIETFPCDLHKAEKAAAIKEDAEKDLNEALPMA